MGIVYAALYWLFMKRDDARGPWNVPVSLRNCLRAAGLGGVHVKDTDFVSIGEYQDFHATGDEWEVFEGSFHVGDADPRARALRAIHWIMEQGEGPSGARCSTTASHFCRFLQIYEDLKANPKLAKAARPVPVNPVVWGTDRKEPVAPESQSITHPESKLWATLFNVRYQMLLLDVLLALSTSRGGDPEMPKQLTSWAPPMRWSI